MKTMQTMKTWKEQLAEQTDPALAREVDVFEVQMDLRRQGRLDDKIFAETRLRRGIYGQRYDNGERHDGVQVQNLPYPSGDRTKGPETLWDAPGMQRIKIPFGGVTPDQMEVLADLSEEYADGILHVTTRQDFQLHFVHIDDTPDLMRRLAAVDITTREACGNSVRNVTACPLAGVCRNEVFDVTPYARACARFLLGHPDVQDFGRKFKVAFSGCQADACGLVMMHDMGAIAATRVVDGEVRRGFQLYVGGGLGAVPHQAQLFDSFLPVEELLPTAQAISRVFARHGEKKFRARARIKFLVARLGIEEFRRLVLAERQRLPHDPRWISYLEEPWTELHRLSAEVKKGHATASDGFAGWYEKNVYPQRQPGFATVTVVVPLGDISAPQARRLADLAREFAGENMRTTVEQNVVFRWVSEVDLPRVYEELEAVGLGKAGAGSITDITACPGTDTCKLGIASSRGLAAELTRRLTSSSAQLDEAVKKLRIKISGCFNSCGQHHVADIGFFGVSRSVNRRKVPHFQVILGGRWDQNAGSYGLGIGSVPAKVVPEALEKITTFFVSERQTGENFQDFVARVGKKSLRNSVDHLMQVPTYEEGPSYYSDWGNPREFSIGDLATGECAGEVVSFGDFELAAAERLVFEAQIKLDEQELVEADRLAYHAMLEAAKGLIKMEKVTVPEHPDSIVQEFKKLFYETRLFHDKYAGSKFADYFLRRHGRNGERITADRVHRRVGESQLFIEAAYACRDRIQRGNLEP